MKNFKDAISLFFATLFFSLKVAGFHVLTHHTDDTDVQHCELCDITTTISFTPHLSSDSEAISQTTILFSELKLKSEAPQDVFYNEPLEGLRFTRPPPQFS
ncbi:hypothetical protein [Poritiphilus flavus]|uniref:Uncharacterized protein n=1 Tax=Poritiphilus flavus TaxID=2697053 RepID=A0A6L9E9J6_9FLAO|nr:hypothetical protein [Poritiphilus flavus]NAS11425.1 hypothetical protein [Poritiphilus flavus]